MSELDPHEVMRAIGRIEGRFDGIESTLKDQATDLREIRGRTRKLEARAAAAGAGGGLLSAVGVSLIVEGIKAYSRGA